MTFMIIIIANNYYLLLVVVVPNKNITFNKTFNIYLFKSRR